jgi:hypothetical protein
MGYLIIESLTGGEAEADTELCGSNPRDGPA